MDLVIVFHDKKNQDLLIHGYLSDVDPQRQCALDLLILFIKYIGGFLEVKFDAITHVKYRSDIKHEGTCIKRKVNT